MSEGEESPSELLHSGAYIPGTASLVAEVDSKWKKMLSDKHWTINDTQKLQS